jgi:hypothetical protein
MNDGLQADPEIVRRVWGSTLPRASDLYDEAIERMPYVAPGFNRVQEAHLLESVESAWRVAIDDPGCATDVLRAMQLTLLATADGVKACMEQYGAADEESSTRLNWAHLAASSTTGAPQLNPTVDLD